MPLLLISSPFPLEGMGCFLLLFFFVLNEQAMRKTSFILLPQTGKAMGCPVGRDVSGEVWR